MVANLFDPTFFVAFSIYDYVLQMMNIFEGVFMIFQLAPPLGHSALDLATLNCNKNMFLLKSISFNLIIDFNYKLQKMKQAKALTPETMFHALEFLTASAIPHYMCAMHSAIFLSMRVP